MTPPSLAYVKKTAPDVKETPEKSEVKFKAPIQVEEDKKEEKQSLGLLLELCKQGLVSTLSEEKTLYFEEEESSTLTEENPSPFIISTTNYFTPIFPLVAPTEQISSISAIPEICLQVLDKLCSEMIVMDSESCITTTFVLETNAFTDSPFYGAKVTISEYSTAPKIFNVSITAGETAVSLLQTHMTSFFEVLETRNFSFGIHNIETNLSTDSWYKEKDQDQGQGQKQKEQEGEDL